MIEDAVRCILCACCTASCPVNQSRETAAYVGPRPWSGPFAIFSIHATKGPRADRPSRPEGRCPGLPDPLEMHGGLPQARYR